MCCQYINWLVASSDAQQSMVARSGAQQSMASRSGAQQSMVSRSGEQHMFDVNNVNPLVYLDKL